MERFHSLALSCPSNLKTVLEVWFYLASGFDKVPRNASHASQPDWARSAGLGRGKLLLLRLSFTNLLERAGMFGHGQAA